MANVAQMAVNEFWTSIQALKSTAKNESAALEANRRKLIAANHDARMDPDKKRSAEHLAILAPLVHRNSVLRMRYRDLVGKFNAAVKAATSVLNKAGLTVPTTLGQIETGVVVGVVAVSALGTAWAIAYSIQRARRNLDNATDLAIRVLSDPSSTPEQRRAAQHVLDIAAKTTPKGPLGLDFGSLTVPLAIVAAIVLLPPVLKAFKPGAA